MKTLTSCRSNTLNNITGNIENFILNVTNLCKEQAFAVIDLSSLRSNNK